MQAPPNWPLYVYYALSIASLPLYIVVLVFLLRLRSFTKSYRTTFYTILLQHCIADIVAMTVFLFIWCFRMLPGLREFYFEYQDFYIAACTYNTIYYFLYIRCTGIIFLSIHRCLVISAPTSLVTSRIQEAATWQIVVVYWTVPTLISIVVLKDTDFHYDSLETMEVVAPRAVITTGPIYTMRALYPIANGVLSYINPFCILLLNGDFARQFVRTLKCRDSQVSEVHMSTINTVSTRRSHL
uniref:G-protein coupled receptors family 1 profile domain-containing protein n=1 Tax=Caenorhabditis japonica TaxID=281687 RepID=A0A8R1DQK5_CAEJA